MKGEPDLRTGLFLVVFIPSLLFSPGVFHTVVGDIEFEDPAVMHWPVNGRRRGHRIFEDHLPFRERQV